jgi:uncharacterized protein (TIGR00255 family)
MTGFGEAHHQEDGLSVGVEVRAVNSRYFKLTVRTTEGYTGLEPQVEEVIRKRVRRGSVLVNVRIDRQGSAEDYRIRTDVLEGYRSQLGELCRKWSTPQEITLAQMMMLPGVVVEHPVSPSVLEQLTHTVEQVALRALDAFDTMRTNEGRSMAADLAANCQAIESRLATIEERAPLVVEGYRNRLNDRLTRVLAEYQVSLDPADLLKEVSLFAERADVSEEIVRLKSHLAQFRLAMQEKESSGRKLEFVCQEMFREVNTIGSKANDVEIANQVISMKAVVERIREMIQNVE